MTSVCLRSGRAEASPHKASDGQKSVMHLTSVQLKRILRGRGIPLPEHSIGHGSLVQLCHEHGIKRIDCAELDQVSRPPTDATHSPSPTANSLGGTRCIKDKVAALGLSFEPTMLLPGGLAARRTSTKDEPCESIDGGNLEVATGHSELEHIALTRPQAPGRMTKSRPRRSAVKPLELNTPLVTTRPSGIGIDESAESVEAAEIQVVGLLADMTTEKQHMESAAERAGLEMVHTVDYHVPVSCLGAGNGGEILRQPRRKGRSRRLLDDSVRQL